ncbi:MAG: hypothetical protein ACRYGP_29985 [Janthinobacterium lividum]
MKHLISGAAMCAALLIAPQARAAPNCLARALADVAAMEAPEEIRSKSNSSFGPVTQIKINKKTGRMYYCAQNTYCYDSNAFQLITPCRIKLDKGYGFNFSNHFTYFTR